jgi:MoaA/NifB/PqqE/SkfB family radical SAM enzyme
MRRITLLTNPDVCNLHCPLCFLNQRALLNCNARSAENGNGDCPPDNGRERFFYCNKERRTLGMGEMSFEVARAAIEKYAAERDASGKRLLREVIPSTMGEPLLYSHFYELLELCESLEIPMNLTTNGTFPGKWGSDAAMELLLRSCSDIKVSYLASEQFDGWKANVEKLVRVRDKLREKAGCEDADCAMDADADCAETAELRVATVSLQVTLHKKNLQEVPEIVSWASAIGIDRIKWNKVVVLSVSSQELSEMYALDDAQLESLRNEFRSGVYSALSVKHEGSLFFSDSVDLCAVGGKCESCPFADEVWVWPDGHEDHCPNPEKRFGCGKNL